MIKQAKPHALSTPRHHLTTNRTGDHQQNWEDLYPYCIAPVPKYAERLVQKLILLTAMILRLLNIFAWHL